MLRSFLTTFILLTFGAAYPATAGQMCDHRNTGIIEIIVGTRNAGQTQRIAYRLSGTGVLSAASWTDQNQLTGVSKTIKLGVGNFDQAIADLKDLKSSPPPSYADGTIPTPPNLTVELALANDPGPVRFILRTDMPAVVQALLTDWKIAAPLYRPKRGTYVWTIPGPHNPGPSDLTVTPQNCGDGLAKTVASGVSSTSIVIPAPVGIENYLAKGSSARSRFIAYLPGDFAYFGVLASG
jgi:hypothetical protein